MNAELQHLENLVQEQAALIEALTSKGILGFFQRRRQVKMLQGEQLQRRLREDSLRNENIRLKQRIRELEEETSG